MNYPFISGDSSKINKLDYPKVLKIAHLCTTSEEFANLPGRSSMEKYGNILQYQQMAYRQFENRGYREREEHYEPLRYDIPLPARYRHVIGGQSNFDTAVREGNLEQVVYWLWRYANHAAQRGDWEVADYLSKCLR